MTKRIPYSRLSVAAIALAAPLVTASMAQAQMEEIVVTARQREENLFEAPLSLTSLSGAELQQSNIKDINDLASYTPGFYYTSQASFSASRLAPAYRFRGMNNSSPDPLQQQGGVFLDGIFLFGGAPMLTFEDIERVEVIKGPQSALFGRSTFSGAVNFITKRPADHFTASATGGVETRGTYDFSGSLEGPVIADRLSLRVTGARNVKGAHFKATDGGDIGRETTNSLNTQAVITPTDKLELRIRRMDSWQDDSKSPVANMNANSPLLANAPNRCRTGADPYWCGAIPTIGTAGVPFAAVSTATSLNPPGFQNSNNPNLLKDILANNTANPLVLGKLPFYNEVSRLNHAGLTGKYARTSLEFKYDFDNGMTFTSDYVNSKLRTMTAQTSSGDDGSGWIISPNVLTDNSAAVRLSSDGKERLTWSVGGNASVLSATRVAVYREPAACTTWAPSRHCTTASPISWTSTSKVVTSASA